MCHLGQIAFISAVSPDPIPRYFLFARGNMGKGGGGGGGRTLEWVPSDNPSGHCRYKCGIVHVVARLHLISTTLV